MKRFVSSYALAPSDGPWDEALESALFDGLARLDLAGLELPYCGSLHRADDGWLLERLLPSWRFLLTPLPGTMARLKEDARFGLASPDVGGRRRALGLLVEARRAVERLRRFLGREAVAAVLLQSAPTGAASADAFRASLDELRGRDWQGAELLIEHCDAAAPGRPRRKGFLPLERELEAALGSSGPTPLRFLLNWGRSAIEARSADEPLRQVRLLREKGLLAGLFFSGATPKHADYGEWEDRHAPFSTACPESLLTPERARACLDAAGSLDYVGVKVQPLPRTLGAAARLGVVEDALAGCAPGSARPGT